MCGIVGFIGKREAAPILLEGLKRLKYRGYDSAGIATLSDSKFDRVRAEGKLELLEEKLQSHRLPGNIGIGHTRWATHGLPVERNAHPHMSAKVAVVHNGIIENFADLHKEFSAQGIVFETETDTEVIVHLLTHYLSEGLFPKEAMHATLKRLHGAFALAVLFKDHSDLLMGARQGPPLVLGHGDTGEFFLGSDALALAPFTQNISYLEDGDWAVITPQNFTIYNMAGKAVDRRIQKASASGELIGKSTYRHYMLKEIHEQPTVIGETLQSFLHPLMGTIGLPPFPRDLKEIKRIVIIACGTSYYAGLVAKYWFETLAQIPTEVDIASEYRYRNSPLDASTLCLFISQSGETADTLAALQHSKTKGALIASLLNVAQSSIDRASDVTLLTHAGPEIGVASTKAFTCQLSVLACFALGLAQIRGTIEPEQEKIKLQELAALPTLLAESLLIEPLAEQIAHQLVPATGVLFLGRHLLYPIALEGALKLKEISYIHAEGYAGGELKHGPIALIDDQMPVVVLSPSGPLFEKMFSNTQEVMARGARVIAIGDRESLEKMNTAKITSKIQLPDVPEWLTPIVYAIPMQLLAYHTATLKGTDVDQPRNLAKSVTVE